MLSVRTVRTFGSVRSVRAFGGVWPVRAFGGVWPVGAFGGVRPVGAFRSVRPVGTFRSVRPVGTFGSERSLRPRSRRQGRARLQQREPGYDGGNSRLTCQTPGLYQITGNVSFADNANGGFRQCAIRLDGATIIASATVQALSSAESPESPTDVVVTTLYQLAAGQYVEFLVAENSGLAMNILALDAQSPEFMMVQIG